jgi:hypothetical protein
MGDENVKIRVGGDTTMLNQALKGGEKRIAEFGRKAADTLKSSFASLGAGMLAPVMGLFAVDRVISKVKELGDMAKKTRNEAAALGVSTEGIQGLRIGAKRAGLDSDQVDKALGKFSTEAGKAKLEGGGPFAKYGISLTDQNGKLKDTETLLGDVADLVQHTADGSIRAAIAADFFGEKLGSKLLPALMQGRAGLESNKNSWQVISKEDLELLERAGKVLSTVGKASEIAAVKLGMLISKNPASLVGILAWMVKKFDNPVVEADLSTSQAYHAQEEAKKAAQERLNDILEKQSISEKTGQDKLDALEQRRNGIKDSLGAVYVDKGSQSVEFLNARAESVPKLADIDKEINSEKDKMLRDKLAAIDNEGKARKALYHDQDGGLAAEISSLKVAEDKVRCLQNELALETDIIRKKEIQKQLDTVQIDAAQQLAKAQEKFGSLIKERGKISRSMADLEDEPFDRGRMTLEQLADLRVNSKMRRKNRGFYNEIMDARQVQRLESGAEAATASGNVGRANNMYFQADAIRRGLYDIKSNERDPWKKQQEQLADLSEKMDIVNQTLINGVGVIAPD